jgi:hypothetical protein
MPNGIGLAGTIISDLSDHFINFIEIIHNFNTTKKIETVTKRAITNDNVDRFKLALQQLRWETVPNKQTVDEAFDEFSNIFNDLYNINFPTMHFQFNKNIHKINDFITTGLLISRQTKAKLHKIAVTNRLPEDILKFKQYRNVFNLIRTSKKLYFEQNLFKNKGNPRKTWELLKEATNLIKSNNKIEKIKVNVLTDNPTDMANAFNEFFSSIGTDISNSLPHTNTDPLSYISTNDDLNLHT